MTPELATLIAAIITVIGGIFAVIFQYWLSNRHKEKASSDKKINSIDSIIKENKLDTIMANKAIKLGCVKHPPLCDFEWKRNVAITSGLYVDMANQVCKNNDLIPIFIPVDWTDIPYAFTELDCDIVLSVFETTQRHEWGDFTACFHKIAITGVTKANDSKVKNLQDLRRDDVRVVVTRGEAGWEFVTSELRLPKHRLIIMENSNLTEMMDYVMSGKVDVAITDEWSCNEFISKNPDSNCVFREDNLYICKNCIMVPKGQPKLSKWVNDEFCKARDVLHIQEAEEKIIADSKNIIRRFT